MEGKLSLVQKKKSECRFHVLMKIFEIKSIADALGYSPGYTYALLNGTHPPTQETEIELDKMLKEIPRDA